MDIDDKKLFDKLMEDEEVKAVIEEHVAIELQAALEKYKASADAKFAKQGKKKAVKPSTFGHYYEDKPKTCRACRFAQECKKASKKISKKDK